MKKHLSFHFTVNIPSYKEETGSLHDVSRQPGNRIGDKQHCQRAVCRKDQIDPDNPGSYCSDNRQQHWHCRPSHSTQCSRDQIHDPTQKIRDRSIKKNFHATGKLITPLGADLLKYDDMPDNSIFVLDKNAAVEKVQAGGVVTDYDKLIDRQLERASITVTTGFSLLDEKATLGCSFGA